MQRLQKTVRYGSPNAIEWIMNENTKPKCELCGKVGEDKYYFWVADKRGKGGKLCHLSCCKEVEKATNNFGRGTC